MGDRWLEVGKVQVKSNRLPIMEVNLPDVGAFIIGRQYLDDGTNDWMNWGPRVN